MKRPTRRAVSALPWESGRSYAVEESTVPDGYAGLQGLYSGESRMPDETTDGRQLHLLNGGEPLQVSTTYTYRAYNRPWVELEFAKGTSTTS